MVYTREMDGKPMRLGVSGNLWRSVLVMYDRGSESYWSQIDGRAFKGPLKGKQLKQVPSTQTTWAAWKSQHPDTLVLKKSAEELAQNKTASHYENYFSDPNRFGMLGPGLEDHRLPGKAKVVGIRGLDHALALDLEHLKRQQLINTEIGSLKLVVFHDPYGNVHVYNRTYKGQELTFRLHEREGGPDIYDQHDTWWDLYGGQVIDKTGAVVKKLDPVPWKIAFWWAWSNFFPESKVIGGIPLRGSQSQPAGQTQPAGGQTQKR